MHRERAMRAWMSLGAALAIACGSTRDEAHLAEKAVEPPAWLDHVQIQVDRTKPAFDQNTEVFLTMLNRSQEPIEVRGLEAAGAAVLEHEGGRAARIHEISVGVKKPIKLLPGKVKSTSLLFEATPGAPRTLRLYDRAFPIAAR